MFHFEREIPASKGFEIFSFKFDKKGVLLKNPKIIEKKNLQHLSIK